MGEEQVVRLRKGRKKGGRLINHYKAFVRILIGGPVKRKGAAGPRQVHDSSSKATILSGVRKRESLEKKGKIRIILGQTTHQEAIKLGVSECLGCRSKAAQKIGGMKRLRREGLEEVQKGGGGNTRQGKADRIRFYYEKKFESESPCHVREEVRATERLMWGEMTNSKGLNRTITSLDKTIYTT